jgi:hypothetical protein
MAAVPHHRHQELEDRLTLEVGALRGDIAALDGRVRQGFTAITQAIGQILARLPEEPNDGGA